MHELKAILKAWRREAAAQDEGILVTVVDVKGSAYRRPGARMLILPDGRRIGSISGGCLESTVAQKAAWWTSAHPTALRKFDTSREDAAWEFGLGCNGIISVLLERCSNPRVKETLTFLEQTFEHQRAGVIATVVATRHEANPVLGSRLFLETGVVRGGELLGSAWQGEVQSAATEAAEERRSRLVHLKEIDVFLEWIEPPQQLVIFGAGHDVIPVYEIANLLGWRITIADTRPNYARPERFPGAEQVVALAGDACTSQIEITPNSAVVLMTHNYPVDRLLVPQILARAPRYLGMLGPRTRGEQLFADIGKDIRKWNIRAPVGLDLGGEGPQAIAVAIISEIQSVLHGRSARPLRERAQPIHGRAIEVNALIKAEDAPGEKTEAVVCENRFKHSYA